MARSGPCRSRRCGRGVDEHVLRRAVLGIDRTFVSRSWSSDESATSNTNVGSRRTMARSPGARSRRWTRQTTNACGGPTTRRSAFSSSADHSTTRGLPAWRRARSGRHVLEHAQPETTHVLLDDESWEHAPQFVGRHESSQRVHRAPGDEARQDDRIRGIDDGVGPTVPEEPRKVAVAWLSISTHGNPSQHSGRPGHVAKPQGRSVHDAGRRAWRSTSASVRPCQGQVTGRPPLASTVAGWAELAIDAACQPSLGWPSRWAGPFPNGGASWVPFAETFFQWQEPAMFCDSPSVVLA